MISLLLALFAGSSRTTREQDFWTWFQQNESMLFHFERDQEPIFDKLAEQLHQVDPNLTFEFSPIKDGRREFIISADGIKASFPRVESLFAAAPKLPHWVFIKFRPRREPMIIDYDGLRVEPEPILYELVPNGSKGDIVLYLPSYTQAQKAKYHSLAFLLLDQALGEFDVEMRVDHIAVRAESEAPPAAQPLRALPEEFDALIPRVH